MRVSVMSCLIGWSLHTVQLCSTLLCAIVLWMLSGESSWQTGFSSVAVGLAGQKQKCWWSAAEIFNPTLIKGMYYSKKTKVNYSTCMCCPRCNVNSDWPLSLPLLTTSVKRYPYLIFANCQKGKELSENWPGPSQGTWLKLHALTTASHGTHHGRLYEKLVKLTTETDCGRSLWWACEQHSPQQ